MAKSFDFDDLKKRTTKLGQSWQKKIGHLSESVSRSGIRGAGEWLKSHHQIEELESAIEDLLKASESEDFNLLQVDTTLNSFVIPDEDKAQAEWYRTAHNLLLEFEKTLLDDKKFDTKKLQAALNELKFISQSNEFHLRYQLNPIQQKVTKVYQTLQQAIIDYKNLEKEKIETQNNQDKLKAAEIESEKAQALAKKAMMDNIKIKEKRLAIIEEKKRKQAELEVIEAQNKQQYELIEIQAKQAESERQAKLQDAYIELQLEEKINNWKLNEVIEILTRKIEGQGIDQDQQQAIKQLIDLLQSK